MLCPRARDSPAAVRQAGKPQSRDVHDVRSPRLLVSRKSLEKSLAARRIYRPIEVECGGTSQLHSTSRQGFTSKIVLCIKLKTHIFI